MEIKQYIESYGIDAKGFFREAGRKFQEDTHANNSSAMFSAQVMPKIYTISALMKNGAEKRFTLQEGMTLKSAIQDFEKGLKRRVNVNSSVLPKCFVDLPAQQLHDTIQKGRLNPAAIQIFPLSYLESLELSIKEKYQFQGEVECGFTGDGLQLSLPSANGDAERARKFCQDHPKFQTIREEAEANSQEPSTLNGTETNEPLCYCVGDKTDIQAFVEGYGVSFEGLLDETPKLNLRSSPGCTLL
jgi:hypothetical protein